jgi:REP element-mobilizing transposase RayT
MARPLRLEFPGALYHVTARGNARAAIFEDDADCQCFLDTLGRVTTRYNWLCHAYCLMGNHYHLMIETPEGNLSQGMRQLNALYTQGFNRRHRRVGHVLQGRFKAILVDRDSYLLELCRYVVLNPVRAKMVKHPKQYRWSSYRASAGMASAPEFLTREWIWAQFSRGRTQAQERYRKFVGEGIALASPWEKLSGQIILGAEPFVQRMARQLKVSETIREVPRQQRFAARPALQTLFPATSFKSKAARDRAIQTAHLEHGYTLTEIGRRLDLHYTTISKIVNRTG